MKETLAAELIDLVLEAADKARQLGFATGDDECMLLAAMLEVTLVAKSKGDLVPVMEAMSAVFEEKTNQRRGVPATLAVTERFPVSAN